MAEKPEFAQRAKRLLFVAGQSIAAHTVKIEPIRQSLNSKGFETFPAVEDFLKEFGILRIVYPYDAEEGILTILILDPIWASERISRAQTIAYGSQVGGDLCPIGQDKLTNDILVMDRQGKVYAGTDDKEEAILVGKTGVEAVEKVLNVESSSQRDYTLSSDAPFESSLFTKRASRLLAFSGWRPDYSIDIGEFEEEYKSCGYETIFPVVQDFLSRFGGLDVIFPFDPELGIMGRLITLSNTIIDRQSVQPWNIITGKTFLPVGGIRGQDTLLMAEDGSLYGGTWDDLGDAVYMVGESWKEAIENILRGNKHIFSAIPRNNTVS